MDKKQKSGEHLDNSTAMQHAVLSVILLGVIMGSLIQITHMLIENRDAVSVAALAVSP